MAQRSTAAVTYEGEAVTRRIVLWRHGRTEWNATGRFQGQSDIDLDLLGHEQARESARRLAALRPDVLVTSDLVRARDTVAYLEALTGLETSLDKRLRETYAGRYQGLLAAEIEAQWPEEYATWRAGDPHIAIGGGESRVDVAQRMVAAVADAAADLPDDGLAVLVTHGGSARCAIASMIGLAPGHFAHMGGLSNCSWSLLRELPTGWLLIEHNAGTLPAPVTIEEG